MDWLKAKYIVPPLFLVFCFLLFKSISYPLLWNDESETVMTAKHILKFGYPKMTDEKNCIFLPGDPTWIAYKKSSDANISIPWGSYYFAAIGVYFAELTDDIYLKGGIIRTTFAFTGLLGLVIFVFGFRRFFIEKNHFYWFFAAFFFFEIFSVTLLLHMREARYYSLVILTVACFFYVLLRYLFSEKISDKKYFILMTIVLFGVYQINVLAFSACIVTMVMYELYSLLSAALSSPDLAQNKSVWFKFQIKKAFLHLSPLLLCCFLIVPFVIYFETFSILERATKFYDYRPGSFMNHLDRLIFVFSSQDFLYAALFLKSLRIIVWLRNLFFSDSGDKTFNENEKKISDASVLFTLFFISFAILVCRMPIFWTRHFIVLQPILTLVIFMDSWLIWKTVSAHAKAMERLLLQIGFGLVLISGLAIPIKRKLFISNEYLFQIYYQYQGPLDFIIPFLKQHYKHPEKLVIATNYEELCYIYYLDCKVTMGYMLKNLEEDMKLQPDVIIFRKEWKHNRSYFKTLVDHGKYTPVVFPVYDNRVNNIAEIDADLGHFFRTQLAIETADQTHILLLEK